MSTNVVDNVTKHMEKLCIEIGSRHVGSPGEAAAVAYISEQFRAQQLDTVLENCPTVGWDCQSFSLVDKTENRGITGIYPCFFSNACDFTDEILWLKGEALDELEKHSVAGRLCMVEMINKPDGVFGRNGIAERLDELGAQAAFFISDHPIVADTKIQRSPFLDSLATMSLAYHTAFELWLVRNHKFHLRIDAQKFDHKSPNVIARIEGSGPNKAVIGCHYDTAPGIQGASDNASGTAAIIELARLLRGHTKDWSVDFVAFGAEEYIPKDFPPGSGGYVKKHKGENIRFLLNFDSCGLCLGETTIQLGFPEKIPELPVCKYQVTEYAGGGDDKAFHAAGFPTLWYRTESPYKNIHNATDSIEKINMELLSEIILEGKKMFEYLINAIERNEK
jgi:Iap family predicted aminopeptidase